MASSIDSHPQRQKIIDAILAGKSLRDIQALVTPRVSIMAIQRYRRNTVVPTLRNADRHTKLLADTELYAPSKRPLPIPESVSSVTQEALLAAPILAVREKRLGELQDRHERLKRVMLERAEEMADETAGGASGLLARKHKMLGSGPAARQVTEYELDTGLLSEFREHEKQAAMELGQWQEPRPAGDVNLALSVMVSIPRMLPEPVEQIEAQDVEFTDSTT